MYYCKSARLVRSFLCQLIITLYFLYINLSVITIVELRASKERNIELLIATTKLLVYTNDLSLKLFVLCSIHCVKVLHR